MKIGIIGGGVVGQATARSYLEHVDEVRVYDTVKERRTCGHPLDVLEWADLVFVCLPTPQKKDDLACDTSVISNFFDWLDNGCRKVNYVLRSTVPIGYTKYLAERYKLPNLVHSPEFLTARCATVDAQLPTRNIIGNPGLPYKNDGNCVDVLCALYRKRFPHVGVFLMSSDESEAVKLFQNSFFAVKVAYWNEVHCLATKLGLDWDVILEAILADGRIHPSHTKVPGPDGKFGFGGTCLPKDLANLVELIHANKLTPHVTEAAYERNLQDRKSCQ